jgi:Amt family ammonium transporter
MNTILAASCGGLGSVFLKHRIAGTYSLETKYDVSALCNGILIGLVSITAGCNNVEPWAALIIGSLSTIVYGLTTRLLIKLKIDDPLEATQIHGFGGMFGVLVVGFFDRDDGLFYGDNGRQLGV